ncbi:IMP dehydrogenase [Pseudomonas entomophila]|uniref:IMP dehydrogenase n=1 Tax=Pseudomonas entomophila TaxID=312306 RepID=UPI00200D9443|nr:IMP dehydrogenase [Pseudomonas entomophila]
MFRKGYVFDDVLLVPKKTHLASRKEADIGVELKGLGRLSVPIISANTQWCTEDRMAMEMARMGGLGIVHRMCSIEDQVAFVHAVKSAPVTQREPDFAPTLDSQGRLKVGGSIGIVDDYLQRAAGLAACDVDFLTLDIAHGHSTHAIAAIANVKERLGDIPIVAGNVATPEGVLDLAKAGASVIKVGIGPGSVCTTRSVTGAGVPQLTAILECAAAAKEAGVSVIADGGIRSSGDIVKALAAGAQAVMLGRMLAGTDESAAQLLEVSGKRFKLTRGFVTFGTNLELKRLQGQKITEEQLLRYVPEGIEACFEYAGPLRAYLYQLIGGVQSGFSYCGASDYPQLLERHEFIEVSVQTSQESRPHALDAAKHPIDYKAEVLSHD